MIVRQNKAALAMNQQVDGENFNEAEVENQFDLRVTQRHFSPQL